MRLGCGNASRKPAQSSLAAASSWWYCSNLQTPAQVDGVQREFAVACSYLEIYNESVTDLLTAGTGLQIREDPRTGPFVEGISVETVENGELAISLYGFVFVPSHTASVPVTRRT